MVKLTQIEATKIMTEAYRLKALFRTSGSRLGQSIHWVCNSELSNLPVQLQNKLIVLLDSDHAGDNDFYHWTDDDKVFTTFYSRYVRGDSKCLNSV
jgi:hypothetical protein